MTSRTERRAAREMRQQQMLQRYHKQRQRNVVAQPGMHEFALVLDNLKSGYNVPKIFRSALAFGAAEIDLINIGPFDPAPSKGAFRKVPARFHEDFHGVYKDLIARDFTVYTLTPDAENALPQQSLPDKSAFVFGHEELGLSFDPADYPQVRSLRIPHCGEMESLNVSIAASIVMYEYVRQRNT